MEVSDFYLVTAFVILLATMPLLLILARYLASPWRTLAARFPGSGERRLVQVSYVMARFRGKGVPFSVVRSVRIRADHGHLVFGVLGFDFPPAKLTEIAIPRTAIRECAPRDTLLTRQKLTLDDPAETIVIYGRGAKFVRNWWHDTPA